MTMRVLGVGHCTLDYLGVVERFAQPDFKIELDQFSVQGGGSVATALVALARWGAEARFVGKVGDDGRGDEIVATLSGEGVDTSSVVRAPGAISQASFIFVEEGSGRKQTYFTHGNVGGLEPGDFDVDAALDGVDVVLVDGTASEAQRVVLERARELGVTTMLDAAKINAGTEGLVEVCSHVIVSERFGSRFTGVGRLEEMCEALLAKGPEVVVVTMGDEGCVAMRKGGEMIRQAAYPVEVFDHTGAGDVFHGGFIWSMMQGMELERAVRLANAAAGLACTDLGGRSSIASIDELNTIADRGW